MSEEKSKLDKLFEGYERNPDETIENIDWGEDVGNERVWEVKES